MITRITKENRGKYLRLFEKATKVLKERGFHEFFECGTKYRLDLKALN